jgi:hypothetical protein
MDKTEERLIEDHTVTLNEVDIHYRTIGEGPVLFLVSPGWGVASGYLQRAFSSLRSSLDSSLSIPEVVVSQVVRPIRLTELRHQSLQNGAGVAFSQINSSPLYNRSVSCELAATFVTQWKAYPISTSLICTTG